MLGFPSVRQKARWGYLCNLCDNLTGAGPKVIPGENILRLLSIKNWKRNKPCTAYGGRPKVLSRSQHLNRWCAKRNFDTTGAEAERVTAKMHLAVYEQNFNTDLLRMSFAGVKRVWSPDHTRSERFRMTPFLGLAVTAALSFPTSYCWATTIPIFRANQGATESKKLTLCFVEQVRLVSVEAERRNHPRGGGVSQPRGGPSTPTQTWLHKAACIVVCNFGGGVSQPGGGQPAGGVSSMTMTMTTHTWLH